MRDPATRIDTEVEAAIEKTRRFLESRVSRRAWKADPSRDQIDILYTIKEVERSNLPDWAKRRAIWALGQQTKKRSSKPTLFYRNLTISLAADRLVKQGYSRTRNDETKERESASSIIHEALRRLGKKLSEKQINAAVLKYPSD